METEMPINVVVQGVSHDTVIDVAINARIYIEQFIAIKAHFGCLYCWHNCDIFMNIYIVFILIQKIYGVNYIINSLLFWKAFMAVHINKSLGKFYCNLFNYF